MKHTVSKEQDKYHRIIAEQYYEFLLTLKGKSEMYLSGIREGKNKFLSNMYGAGLVGKKKYMNAQYTSKAAKEHILNPPKGKLVFEHVVPKQKFIQKPLEEAQDLTVEMIHELLNKFYVTAVVTKEEDRKLRKSLKQEDFAKNIFSRYEGVVELEVNPHFKIK